MSIIFGNLTESFVNFGIAISNVQPGNATSETALESAAAGFRHSANKDALILVYIGIAMLVCTFVYMTVWVYTGEVASKRVRERYLKAVLRQDVAYFDNVGAGEVASRIQTDTRASNHHTQISRADPPLLDLVQQGISEKVALSVQFVAAFITGFVVAYIRSWRLALALSSILPCLVITGGIMNKFVSKYMQCVCAPFQLPLVGSIFFCQGVLEARS